MIRKSTNEKSPHEAGSSAHREAAHTQKKGITTNARIPETSHRHQTIESALAEALAAHDVAGVDIQADGSIHRFDSPEKRPGNKSGWYVCPTLEVAVFGFWHTGHQTTVSIARGQDLATAEAARNAARKAREQREQEQLAKREQAANRARGLWKQAGKPDTHHPYLVRKAIRPNRARQRGTALVLDIRGFDRQLYSLQFIESDGSKKLLSNGAKKGNFILVGGPADPARVLVCEGWATGCTLLEAEPNALVLAAIDAGNLQPVALGARRIWPDAELVVCGDDDRATEGNPGRRYAREAAIAAGGAVALPDFPDDAPDSLSDFNDLANWKGAA